MGVTLVPGYCRAPRTGRYALVAQGRRALDPGVVSRGMGRIQRAVLAHLRAEPGGLSALTGLPGWVPVHQLAAAVYGVEAASDGQRASVRRPLRLLEAAGLVDVQRLALEGLTYTQQRGAPRHPVPVYGPWRIEVCAGADCEHCRAGRLKYPGTAMGMDVIDALLEQNGYIQGQVQRFAREGWHWVSHERPGAQRRRAVQVTISETCARRATTADERAAGDRALRAYVARFTTGFRARPPRG